MSSQSKSLEEITRLLTHFRLPIIMDFTATVYSCPSKQELSSFLVGIQTSNRHITVERLSLDQLSSLMSNNIRSEAPLLRLEDLRPCMTFSSLRQLELNTEWNVGLTDSELLALTSSWPHLEFLFINLELEHARWNHA